MTTTIIKGDLIIDNEMAYNGDLIVRGNILGKNNYIYNLTVNGSINARNIHAWNISAKNITAKNITARNITAFNIKAENITARGDINTWDIKAKNIIYYAVCFAYYNIKCKSIKGTRDNARHFVLDGKIEVVE